MKKIIESKRSRKTKPGIKNKNSALHTDPGGIKCRWKECIKELYAKEEKPKVINIVSAKETDFNSIGPEIMEAKIGDAIKEMKTRKAAGCDGKIPQ